jgi:hypothetical protein
MRYRELGGGLLNLDGSSSNEINTPTLRASYLSGRLCYSGRNESIFIQIRIILDWVIIKRDML